MLIFLKFYLLLKFESLKKKKEEAPQLHLHSAQKLFAAAHV